MTIEEFGRRLRAREVTSEEVTDLGGGATFYDNLVDVRLAD